MNAIKIYKKIYKLIKLVKKIKEMQTFKKVSRKFVRATINTESIKIRVTNANCV